MKRLIKWLRVKLGIVQVEKELSGIYKTVNRLDVRLSKLKNQTVPGKRPRRYEEVNRDRKLRKKEGRKLENFF